MTRNGIAQILFFLGTFLTAATAGAQCVPTAQRLIEDAAKALASLKDN